MKHLHKIFSFLSGLFFIFIYIYLRLRKRLPVLLIDRYTFPFSLLSFFMLGIHFYLLFTIWFPRVPHRFVRYFYEFVINSLTVVFIFFYNHFVITKLLIARLAKFLYKRKNYNEYIYFFLDGLPKYFVSCIFLIDIFLFDNFEYFYKALILLILPVIYQILLFMINYYSTDLQNEFNKYYEILRTHKGKVKVKLFDPTLKTMLNEQEYKDNLYFSVDLYNMYEEYKDLKSLFYFKKLLSAAHINYIIGWSFILLNSILNIKYGFVL